MRILLLSSVEHHSGSAIRFRGLAGALARRGHEVHLLEPVPPGTKPETPSGVVRHPCPRSPFSPEMQAPLWLLFGALAVLRVRPQVVWALKALPNVWIPARIAWWAGARTAVDIDDLDAAYVPRGWKREVLAACFRSAIRNADDVTVHNVPLEMLVRAARGGRSAPVFVDQGIDVARFDASHREKESLAVNTLRRSLDLGVGPVLLYAGHLGPASNLGSLLPSLRRVAMAHPGARLLVVGGGRDQRRLEALAAESLPAGFARFVGRVDHRDVPRYFALADLALNYLEPNEANRHRASIKVREALAAGVPVVTTRTPDGERFAAFVRLVDLGPPDDFVNALLDELAHPRPERSAKGVEWLRAHGTHEEVVRSIAEIWEREVER